MSISVHVCVHVEAKRLCLSLFLSTLNTEPDSLGELGAQ